MLAQHSRVLVMCHIEPLSDSTAGALPQCAGRRIAWTFDEVPRRRAQPTGGIALVLPSGQCVCATRPGLSRRSPVLDQVMTHRPSSRHDPCSQIAPEARRRQGEARSICETLRRNRALVCAALALLEWGRTLLLQHPHMPPPAAASAFRFALMPGCSAPGAAQPNPNATRHSPIPTEYKCIDQARYGYPQPALT